ncbi:hypothetical protein Y032_0179g701 [Ancylostoma ceylanicum]|nr:hypothetical protein Y032_0179g701 [Ancylostoma ceylanicum]
MDVFAGKSQGSQINYARGAINVGGAIEQQSRRCFLPTPVDGLWIEVPRKKNGVGLFFANEHPADPTQLFWQLNGVL